MMDFVQARRNMVDCQLRTFDVSDRAVLAGMAELPRERFVPPGREDLAYLDASVETTASAGGETRKMLAPMVLARLVQALGISAGARALDVAGGAGFTTALLGRLGADVVMLESEGTDLSGVEARLKALGLAPRLVAGPLATGVPDEAPYDVILVNGIVGARPEALLAQLSPAGGRLACLQDEGRTGRAMLYVRSGDAIGLRMLFDAAGPRLAAFQPVPEFVF